MICIARRKHGQGSRKIVHNCFIIILFLMFIPTLHINHQLNLEYLKAYPNHQAKQTLVIELGQTLMKKRYFLMQKLYCFPNEFHSCDAPNGTHSRPRNCDTDVKICIISTSTNMFPSSPFAQVHRFITQFSPLRGCLPAAHT